MLLVSSQRIGPDTSVSRAFDHGGQRGWNKDGFRLWLWLRWGSSDLGQGCGQLVGRVGGQELAAGLVCNALHLGKGFGIRPDIETDHMGGEVNPSLFQKTCGCTRVGIAGLHPVADQDDRCLFLGVAKGLRRSDHRVGHRRFAQRLDSIHRSRNLRGRSGGRGHNGFNIRTLAAFAMAVHGQAKTLFRREIRQQVSDNILRDGDLGDTVHLSPHRP